QKLPPELRLRLPRRPELRRGAIADRAVLVDGRLELGEQWRWSRAAGDARAQSRVLLAMLPRELLQPLGAPKQLDDAAELLAARHPSAAEARDHLVGVAHIGRRQLVILPGEPQRVGR